MKYGPYEKYIRICLRFLCSGWNSALKLSLCRISLPFYLSVYAGYMKITFCYGQTRVDSGWQCILFGFSVGQWNKEWNCLYLNQWDFYPWHQQSKDFVVWFLVRKFFLLFRKFQLLALWVHRIWSLLEIYDQFPMWGFLMFILQLHRLKPLNAVVSERTDLK